jgi:ElaB/YqjD/DUF883 family membrane-anchored ribosome-binding protein
MKSMDTAAQIRDAADDLKSHARLTGSAAMDMGRATYRHVQTRAVNAARQTDRAVRGSPYVALGLSFVTGLALGAFLARPKAKPAPAAEE